MIRGIHPVVVVVVGSLSAGALGVVVVVIGVGSLVIMAVVFVVLGVVAVRFKSSAGARGYC